MGLYLISNKEEPKTVLITGIDSIMESQNEFHDCFAIPTNEATQDLYVTLVDEEHEEWIEEFYSPEAKDYDELKELTDLLYVTAGLAYQLGYSLTELSEGRAIPKGTHPDDSITDFVVDVVTGDISVYAITSLLVAILAYAELRKWDLLEAYRRVHKSNMSKLDDNKKPIRREDGKILKGPNYAPPDLKDLTNGD